MYFKKFSANNWFLLKTVEEYTIEYGVENNTLQMHLNLNAIIDDPNSLTSARTL